jgi:hypothetical protein
MQGYSYMKNLIKKSIFIKKLIYIKLKKITDESYLPL